MNRGVPVLRPRRAQSRRRARGAAAIGATVALLAAGCTAETPVEHPSRVLQTVNATLSPSGAVTAVESTAISVDDAAGTSSATESSHAPADVADDLPVRVTTQYRTADRSGTDLADLDGVSGRVEIELTVENLTVRPQELRYDVAGGSRTDPALVGAPLSVAASTVLPGTDPSSVRTDDDATNGIVGATPEGETVVQWGALLAPPRSGASTTLRLVADVEEFQAPTIDLAVQPGLATDLSIDGVLAGAFDGDGTSELAMQQRTIDLIGEVTTVLSRAGETITDVRTNLESTSETLGVSTAERLRDSSDRLAGTMDGLADQLDALGGDLSTTVTGTQSTATAQLAQTVQAVDQLLGDTSATAPTVQLEGDGCDTTVRDPAAPGNVYGSLLQMSAQLDGYAQASAECRDEVAASLAATVGPAEPNADACRPGEPASASMTCALFVSGSTISATLLALFDASNSAVKELKPTDINAAITTSEALDGRLAELDDEIAALTADGGDDESAYGDARDAIDAAISDAREQLSGLEANRVTIADEARDQRNAIGSADGRPWDGSLARQNRAAADAICELAVEPDEDGEFDRQGLTPSDAERLRAYLSSERCDAGEQPQPDEDGNTPDPKPQPRLPWPFDTAMDQRLDEQREAWDRVFQVAAGDGEISSTISTLTGQLKTVEDRLTDADEAVNANDDSADERFDEAIALLIDAQTDLDGHSATLKGQLDAVKAEQDQLADEIDAAFTNTRNGLQEFTRDTIREQTRVVAAQATTGREAVVDAFNRSIAGLGSTAGEVVTDARDTIDERSEDLGTELGEVAGAIDEQTAATLERVNGVTQASTRDVEGAATLLSADLARVMLDLGDREVDGSGLLGSMATSAARSDTADVQLALATRNAAGYANVRAEDIAGLLLRQAQFTASLDAAAALPAFHLDIPEGATSRTLYGFTIGGGE